jgi:beta-phosphoglucomutase
LPGVYEFLLELKTNHIKLALGSESKNAKLILQRIELYMLFDSVIDGNKVTKAKPDPEIYLKASDELGLKPAECIVFENTKAGIEAVHNASMLCVGVGIHEDIGLADIMIPGFGTIEWKDILKMLSH